MYKVIANDDYEVGKYPTIEQARKYGRELVENGWFLYCRTYQNDEWVEDIKA